MSPHRWAALLVGVLVAAPVAGAHPAKVRVSVVPKSSFADQPVHIRVAGLHPRSSARIRLRVRDAGGKVWRSSALFRADARGTVDLDRSVARSGSYAGRWGMGLVASLTTRTRSTFYRFRTDGSETFRIDVRVRGRSIGSGTFRRGLPGAVVEQPISIADAGFYGRYDTRQAATTRLPGILLFGGSDGGLPTGPLPTMLAAHGYPTLSLAYWRAPGLPSTLANIPLEYFERALLWLRAQPQVDPARVVVIGVSRGSEAAQLLGVHYPDLVNAVVASVPSNVAICSFPDCSSPAWTFEGQAVPYTSQFNNPSPTDNPNAVIPDERIRGPLFLVCGGLDSIWISCFYQQAILNRLAALGHPYRDASYAYRQAGHGVGSLLPYAPLAPRALYFNAANERAREAVWPHLLSFLARL